MFVGGRVAELLVTEPGSTRSAPTFLATKWAAFHDRGNGDWYGSHDIEDIVAVVAGRKELMEELRACDAGVRSYVAAQTRLFLESGFALDVIAGALPDARLIPDLVGRVEKRLASVAVLA